MNTIAVYFFTKYDIETDQSIRSKYPATREAIARVDGVAIESTGREVDQKLVSEDGIVRHGPADT